MRRRAAAALVVWGIAAPPAAVAQRYWSYTVTPLPYYSTVDGLWASLHARAFSPVGVEQRPEPHLAWVTAVAGLSTEGSYRVELDAQAPAWWPGWRFGVSLAARRANRHGYYGTGNDTPFSDDSITGANPYFYRVSRTTRTLRATVQRRLVGPVRLLAGGTVEHTDFRALPGETVFERDVAVGVIDESAVPFGDAVARIGLVVDTRDHEVDPHQGVLVEVLYAAGNGYRRATLAAQGYARPAERLTIAARIAAERLSSGAPLAVLMEMESSEGPVVVLGGYRSLRGYHDSRFVGSGRLLGGAEVRYVRPFLPPDFELHLVGFYDVGRVFAAGEAFRLTADGLHTGWGAEVAARLGRNALLVVGAGFGAEDWQLLVETRWSY